MTLNGGWAMKSCDNNLTVYLLNKCYLEQQVKLLVLINIKNLLVFDFQTKSLKYKEALV